MTDELDVLRATRAAVDPPSEGARRAARARWESQSAALGTVTRLPSGGVKTFTTRTAIAGLLTAAMIASVWSVTRARIASVRPKHVLAIGSLAEAAATEPQVFLLVGTDSRAFVKDGAAVRHFGDPSAVNGERSDTMVLVRIDPATRHVLVVSIPRDLWVDVPGCGMSKINAAFNSQLVCSGTHGSAQLLVETIRRDLDVPINHVIEVQFPQFAALVDQLGGLRIDFPAPTRDTYTGLAEPAGCVTLTGDQALAFVRARHYESNVNGQWVLDALSDLGRIQRQQLALRQLAAAADRRAGTDPRPMLRALFANITVDRGFTADDALRYFAALRPDHPTITRTLPAHPSFRDRQSVLILDPSAQPLLAALAGHESIAESVSGAVHPSGRPGETGVPGESFAEPSAC